MIKVAINGFGRIGRITTRILLQDKNIQLVAINDLADVKTMAHLFKYDSTHGVYDGTVNTDKNYLIIDNNRINYYQEKKPSNLPWKELDIDIVIEATGLFKTEKLAEQHLNSGAKKVIISAPPNDNNIKTVVLGVNESIITANDKIISNASCTTNNAAPMIELLNKLCEIESCYITTIHSYTGDQRLHDAPHKDLRRARAAVQSIVPTTTGAAKALTKIFPKIEDKIGGCGIRVPVQDGSLTDITCIVRNPISIKEINQAFKDSAKKEYSGILEYSDESIVSVDIIGNTHSCLFDSLLTSVIGNMVKIVGWYDNEMGYSNRLVELTKIFHNKT